MSRRAETRVMVGILAALAAIPARAALPEGWEAQGALAKTEGWMVAGEPVTVTGALAPDTVTRLTLRLGALERPVTVRIAGDEGPALELRLQALDAEYRVNIIGQQRIPLPDACIELRVPDPAGGWLFKDRYFIRPFPHWYEGAERQALGRRLGRPSPCLAAPAGVAHRRA